MSSLWLIALYLISMFCFIIFGCSCRKMSHLIIIEAISVQILHIYAANLRLGILNVVILTRISN